MYVTNRILQHGLLYLSPFEKLLNIKPNVSHLRVFGCVCDLFVPSHLCHKMEMKVVRTIFVGYDQGRNGWRCCDLPTRKCYMSKNVVLG